LKRLMRGRALIDLRNVYKPGDVAAAGLDHFGIGTTPTRTAGAALEAAE
jgi:hypothetical protein